jgi:hypothetical protein
MKASLLELVDVLECSLCLFDITAKQVTLILKGNPTIRVPEYSVFHENITVITRIKFWNVRFQCGRNLKVFFKLHNKDTDEIFHLFSDEMAWEARVCEL